MSVRKIALDPGYGAVKVADGQKVVVIPSQVGVGNLDMGLLRSGLEKHFRHIPRPHQLSFNDVTYLVGDGVGHYARPIGRLDLDRLLFSPDLAALIFASLGLLLGEGRHEICLLVGLPVVVLAEKERAERTIKALKAWEGKHSFRLDGKDYEVFIHQIKAMAQPLGAYFYWGLGDDGSWARSQDDFYAPVGVLDVGFNTVDLIVIEAGRISRRYTGGDQVGIRRAVELIISNVRLQYGRSLEPWEAVNLINGYFQGDRLHLFTPGGRVDPTPAVAQAIEATGTELARLVETIWGDASSFSTVIFTGGGVPIVHRAGILARHSSVFVPANPVTGNVEGLAKYAQRPGVWK